MTLRKKIEETPQNTKQTNNNQEEQTPSTKTSGYEQCREKRIKENMERMQKLGIFALSLKLNSQLLSPAVKRTPRKLSSPSSLPTRRSPRLHKVSPARYSGKDIQYGKDGLCRETCHQCRQKTLRRHTHCSKCYSARGQFCGSCLRKRYGEHLLEVKQNPNWICPVCRGICNCSLCRKAKGWPATGHLYSEISKLGFSSVAHYLIQRTERRSDDIATDAPVLVKRSLPFADTEEVADRKDSLSSDDWQHEIPNHGFIDKRGSKLKDEEDNLHNVSNVEEDEKKLEKEQTINEHVISEARVGDFKGQKKKSRRELGVGHTSSETEANLDTLSVRLRKRRKTSDEHIQSMCTETKPGVVGSDNPFYGKSSTTFADNEEVGEQKGTFISDIRVYGRRKHPFVNKKRDLSEAEKKELMNLNSVLGFTKVDDNELKGEKEELMNVDDVKNVKDNDPKGEAEEAMSVQCVTDRNVKCKEKSVLVTERNPDSLLGRVIFSISSIAGRLKQRRNRS
ncbi:hypothetical protein IFM89_010059 [Coptis chinensis]|uniref:Zinc-finger domain-containing protein n=1 Tax=Coptis chinensis TaxID=261450 RepID=A0A835HM63_9MAGN|nr:hypothetical protein IFM89_010059 [Coptis chinensis]